MSYRCYATPPPDGSSHGGTAVLVHTSVEHSAVPLVTGLQATAVSVVLGKRFTVCSLYLPPGLEADRGPFTALELWDLIRQLPPPFVLLGDFNAHNPLWGGSRVDRWGSIIGDVLDDGSVSLLNDGSATRFDLVNNSSSAVDLSLCSPSLVLEFVWSVRDSLYGSDHFGPSLSLSVFCFSEVEDG